MHPNFKESLDNGLIVAATFADGSPFIIDGVQHYQATEDGMRINLLRFAQMSDKINRHDALKLTEENLTTGLSTVKTMLKRIVAQAPLNTEQVLDATQTALVTLERLDYQRQIGLSVEQLYEIAAIFYITEDEDPGKADPAINRRKINRWLEHDDALVVYWHFLRSPIGQFMPLDGFAQPELWQAMRRQNIEQTFNAERVAAALRGTGADNQLLSQIEQQQATQRAVGDVLADLLALNLPVAALAQSRASNN